MQDISTTVPTLVVGATMYLIGLFVGPAWSNLAKTDVRGLMLDDVLRSARELSGPRTYRSSRASSSPSMSDGERLAFWSFTVFGVVTLYIKYQTIVLVVILCLSALLSLVATTVLLIASRRGIVVPGLRLRVTWLVPFVFTTVGLFTMVFLMSPPAGGPRLRSYLRKADTHGVLHSLDGFGFVAYQVLGVGAFLLVALGSLAFSLANLSGLYVVTGAWGQPLWRLTTRWTSGAASAGFVWILVLLVCPLALGLSGGWIYEWVAARHDAWPD